jgi:hypothetical protein
MKLNRTDLTKLIVMQLQAQAEEALVEAKDEVERLRRRFEQECCQAAQADFGHVVWSITDSPFVRCLTTVALDDPDTDTVRVCFSDAERSYEGDFRWTVAVKATPQVKLARKNLRSGMIRLQVALRRDHRASAMKDDARKEIILAALKGEGGAELLTAAKKIAVSVGELLHDEQQPTEG